MQLPVRGQRMLVILAVAVVTFAVAFVPIGQAERARAANPVGCSPDGSTDVNRASLTLADGTVITPCISHVNLNFHITGSGGAFGISKIVFPNGNNTVPVKFVDGTVENLYHITFQSFQVNANAAMTVHPSLGSTNPPYTLTIAPDTAATIGGTGVNTDLWVTGASDVALVVIGCWDFSIAGAAGLSWLINGSSWIGCNANLDVRYMAAYVPGAATSGVYPLKLPNTTLTVS